VARENGLKADRPVLKAAFKRCATAPSSPCCSAVPAPVRGAALADGRYSGAFTPEATAAARFELSSE